MNKKKNVTNKKLTKNKKEKNRTNYVIEQKKTHTHTKKEIRVRP